MLSKSAWIETDVRCTISGQTWLVGGQWHISKNDWSFEAFAYSKVSHFPSQRSFPSTLYDPKSYDS